MLYKLHRSKSVVPKLRWLVAVLKVQLMALTPTSTTPTCVEDVITPFHHSGSANVPTLDPDRRPNRPFRTHEGACTKKIGITKIHLSFTYTKLFSGRCTQTIASRRGETARHIVNIQIAITRELTKKTRTVYLLWPVALFTFGKQS